MSKKVVNVLSFVSIILQTITKHNKVEQFKLTVNDVNEWHAMLAFDWATIKEATPFNGHTCCLPDFKDCIRCKFNTLHLTAITIIDTFTPIDQVSLVDLFAFTCYVYMVCLNKKIISDTSINIKRTVIALQRWHGDVDKKEKRLCKAIGKYCFNIFKELNN